MKQLDGCPIGGSFLVVFARISVAKLENDAFDKRNVDDISYVIRKKGERDILNSYHPNMILTEEINPNQTLVGMLMAIVPQKCIKKK